MKFIDSGIEILNIVNNQINIKKDFINNRNNEANTTCKYINNGLLLKKNTRINLTKKKHRRNSLESFASLREDSKIEKTEKPIWQKVPISKKDSKTLIANKLKTSRATFSFHESNENKIPNKMNDTQKLKYIKLGKISFLMKI